MIRREKHSEKKKEKICQEDYFPSVIKFETTYAVVENTFRRYWALVSYPNRTSLRALLASLGEMSGISIHMKTRRVGALEEGRIWQNAQRMSRYRMGSNQVKEQAEGNSNSADAEELLMTLQREKEPLLAVSVYLEMCASTLASLDALSGIVRSILSKSGISPDEMFLRQKEGFLSVCPGGCSSTKSGLERWMPARSAANLFPLRYSRCQDPLGLPIGKDDEGHWVSPDFDKRDEERTNGNILILGNSGEGKSFLSKILVMNQRENGHRILILDPEGEYEGLAEKLGGVVVRFNDGGDCLNPLDGIVGNEMGNEIAGHISYVLQLLCTLYSFSESECAMIERTIFRVYEERNIREKTDLSLLSPEEYPTLEDVKQEMIRMYKNPTKEESEMLDHEVLKSACLGLFRLGEGVARPFFFQKTKIHKEKVVCLSLRGMERLGENIRSAMLLHVFHYVSSVLLGQGNSVAVIDELHLFLRNRESLEIIRGAMKRVRKVGSSMILASQNVEDFMVASIREYAKPLFSIPTHRFLFHPGVVSESEYRELLRLEEEDFRLIASPSRGQCLYISGKDRFHVHVGTTEYKRSLMEA